MKLCKDCKHCVLAEEVVDPDDAIHFSKCKRTMTHEPVVGFKGEADRNSSYCIAARTNGWLGARVTGFCGKEGRFWEAK